MPISIQQLKPINMTKRSFIHLLFIVLLFSCKNQKSTIVSIEGDALKSLNSKFFPSVIKQDSIKILKFDTVTIESMQEETLHYIDLKITNTDKNRLQRITLSEIKLKALEYMRTIEKLPKDSLTNPYSEIYGTYTRVEKLNGDYCINNNLMDYFFCITDSLFVLRSQEGFEGYSYAGVSKENNNYILEIIDRPKNRKFEIKFLYDSYNASIWREVYYLYSSNPDTTYYLLVPTKNINKIPVLYTLYSGGFDDSFNKYDNISLEDLFNKKVLLEK